MNTLKKYLDKNSITRYQISKKTGIANTTLASAVKDTKPLSGQTVKVISAVAEALGKTPGTVLDELLQLEKESKRKHVL